MSQDTLIFIRNAVKISDHSSFGLFILWIPDPQKLAAVSDKSDISIFRVGVD